MRLIAPYDPVSSNARYWNRSVVRSVLVLYLRPMLTSRKSLVKEHENRKSPNRHGE